WNFEVVSGKPVKLDTSNYADPGRAFDAVWAPDSNWIAYSKNLTNHLRAIFIYSVAEGKAHQISDGLADSVSPAFDAGGKYVYFLSSTDYRPRTSGLEMSSLDRPVRRSIYLAVLSAKDPSPLLPETGDEPQPAGDEPKPKPDAAKSVIVHVDFDKIG